VAPTELSAKNGGMHARHNHLPYKDNGFFQTFLLSLNPTHLR